MRTLLAATASALLLATPAFANDDPPPSDAMPLSEILQSIEQESGFSHFEDIEWDDGRWEIEYRANDRQVEVKVDPVSGEAR
ncbi:MAG TPA: PepSY domain-containing protein [Kiloniellales bacterium]|nr:PepSY domain-containing protein [Kiloniellales bacterium]